MSANPRFRVSAYSSASIEVVERSRSWGVLDASGFRRTALSCLLTGSVACGGSTSDPADGGTASGGAQGSSSAGGSTASSITGSSSSAGGSSAGNSAAGSITGSSGTAGSPEGCDCDTRDCRPAPEVANDLCSGNDLVTYTEREGCDYVELSLDYNRGWQAYYYDEQRALVAFGLDNAFGGSVHCGVVTSCTGDIIQHCRVCRASWLPEDTVPDCPATLWETAGW